MSNRKTLLHDIEHHAKDKAELVYILTLLFASELNPLGWQSLRAGKANNSWRIYRKQENKPTEIWYFTGYGKNEIQVRNNYHLKSATERFTITTRVEAIRFVRHVVKQSQKKHVL